MKRKNDSGEGQIMEMQNKRSSQKIEWTVFVLFTVSLAIVSFFHEPWFDEAQAWQIARCASLREILFELPHYEGHPALWHLMLFLPARLGFPYELSLALFAFLAISASGWLLLFRSPFPMAVRCLLPFHYFIFYQNGVISRPYGYMMFAFLLLALFFETRNERPWRFVFTLAFLCALSGYGIVLAGGISVVWLMEILRRRQWKMFIADFWKEKSVRALMVLLVIAILLILQILPDKRAYAYTEKSLQGILGSLFYSVFLMTSEGTLLANTAHEGHPMLYGFMLLAGIAFLLAFLILSTKRNRLYFFIPFLFFSLFASVVYFGNHHLAIWIAFVIFWLWIAFRDPEKAQPLKRISGKIKLSERDAKALRMLGIVVGLIPVCIPVTWTVVASYHEVTEDYFFSKKTAEFIKSHGLESASFLAEWGEVIDEEWTEEEYFENINANGLYVGVDPVAILPYFDHNFCMNLNGGRDDKAFAIHRVATAEESREAFRQLKEMGPPDALLGLIELSEIYGDEVQNGDYVPVYKMSPRFVSIWKIFKTYGDSFKSRYIYVRKDLLEKYGLERINE